MVWNSIVRVGYDFPLKISETNGNTLYEEKGISLEKSFPIITFLSAI